MSDGPCILFKRLLPPLTRCIPRVPVDSDLMDRRSFPVRAGESRNAVQRGIESRRKKLASVRKIDASALSREIHEFSSARRHSSLVRDRARHTRWHFQFSGNYSSPPHPPPIPEVIAISAIARINVVYTLPFESPEETSRTSI